VVSVFVKICSATYQMADDPSLLISTPCSRDGAAAAVLRETPEGLELIDSSATSGATGIYPLHLKTDSLQSASPNRRGW
jgi:predicted naringenin-chalcone synthase